MPEAVERGPAESRCLSEVPPRAGERGRLEWLADRFAHDEPGADAKREEPLGLCDTVALERSRDEVRHR
jgi:hypothetical protein